ncbi:MAG: glycosyltransferase family 39 protein [Candidatus Alcyoniella australis]|nr:glycosyltransferase family 39 protein [Candidatus Alcyoniella australis]
MNKGESPAATRIPWALIWTLLALTAYIFFFVTTFRSLGTQSDALKYASAARSLLRGDGAVTLMVHTISFSNVEPGTVREAASMLGPLPQYLWTMVLAVAFLVFGAADTTAAATCGLFYVLSVPLVFGIARRLFGLRAAHLAAALAILEANALYYSLSGMSESMFGLLLLLLVYALVRRSGAGWGLIAGLALGLIVYSREIGPLYALPLVLLVLSPATRRWQRIIGLLVGLLLVVGADRLSEPLRAYHWQGQARVRLVQPAPETAPQPTPRPTVQRDEPGDRSQPGPIVGFITRKLRHVIHTHSPLHPGHSYARGLEMEEGLLTTGEHVEAILYRARTFNLPLTLRSWFWSATNPLLLWAFWLAPFMLLRSREQLWPWLSTVGALLAVGAILQVLFVMERYYHPAILLMIVFAAGGFSRLAGLIKREGLRRAACVALVLAATFPWGITAGIERMGRFSDYQCRTLTMPDPEFYSRLGQSVAALTGPEEVGVSDTPWLVNWYGDRVCIWLPKDAETLELLMRRTNVDFMLLTFHLRGSLDLRSWEEWLQRASELDGKLDGFEFIRGLRIPGGRFWLFRSDVEYLDAPTGGGA